LNQDNETCFLNSPVGWLEISANGDGLRSIRFIATPPIQTSPVGNPHLKRAYKQLNEYFRGERMRFDIPLCPDGTDFQRNVWNHLSDIPFGTTVSYGDLAKSVGSPRGARAIGMANNRNPLPIVVPCHRVLGGDGKLVGYASGVEIKRKLLSLEGHPPKSDS
jgi:methylated-DNA-[protein]-cysteine S-methyltransferase